NYERDVIGCRAAQVFVDKQQPLLRKRYRRIALQRFESADCLSASILRLHRALPDMEGLRLDRSVRENKRYVYDNPEILCHRMREHDRAEAIAAQSEKVVAQSDQFGGNAENSRPNVAQLRIDRGRRCQVAPVAFDASIARRQAPNIELAAGGNR